MDDGFGRFGYAANFSLNAFSSWSRVSVGAQYGADITLRLDSPGPSSLYIANAMGTKRKWGDIGGVEGPEHASLALGLGRSSTSSENSKRSSGTTCTMSSAKESTDEESSMDLGLNFQLNLGSDNAFSPKKHCVTAPRTVKTMPICDLQLSLSTGNSESVITNITPVSAPKQNSMETSAMISPAPTIDEESTTSSLEFGSYMVPPPYSPEPSSGFTLNHNISLKARPVPATPDLPSTMQLSVKRPVACTSGITHPQQQCNASTKNCQFQGCSKGARGASGLCIAHGGGRRCQKAGCQKGAEGKTIYCKAHGGGRRCQHLGCTKSAEGRTDYCIAHGGGRRCSHKGCVRAARGKSGLCIRHGGGKRCQMENCTRSAEGYSGLCISHGGGRRCQFPLCTKGAQGSTMFCKAHGGGKRCTVPGCTKGAEGSTPYCKGHGGGKRCSFQGGGVCPKSVHGGTLFCVAHGGGKRCAVPDCTKSARGRTDYCVRHGGGKRCKSEGCGKSAQGSTDFCKAHGGGKRCSWVHAEGQPCDRFARGKTGLCAAHSALVQDRCVHGGGTLGPGASRYLAPVKHEKLKEVAIEEKLLPEKGRGESFMGWNDVEPKDFTHPMILPQPKVASAPEGRVHGGSLMATMLSDSARAESHSNNDGGAGTSDDGMSYTMVHRWM